MTSKMDLSVFQAMHNSPRMLGNTPITFPTSGGVYMRKSEAVPQGYQVFAKANGNPAVDDANGNLIAIDWLVSPRADLVGRYNTIVLNPLDYEAVKKSMMEAPKKDDARREYGRKHALDLIGFDPSKAFKH